MTKALVVGVGGMGQHHARVYNDLKCLSGIVDLDITRAKKVADRFGVFYSDSLSDAIGLVSPSYASVAVPTPYHKEVTETLLYNNIHVLLEKPMTPTVEDATSLISLASKQGLTLGVGYIETFNPAFSAVKELHSNKFFGDIVSVNIRRVGGEPRSADNVIIDLMTHDFGLLIDLFNRAPNSVSVNQSESKGVVNSSQVLLSFDSASASCEANWCSPIKIRQIVVTGTKGYCEVDLIKQSVTLYTDPCDLNGPRVGYGQPQKISTIRYNVEPLKAEIEGFINTIEKQDGVLVSGKRGQEILETTLLASHLGYSS